MTGHFISATCEGEICTVCYGEGGRVPATHKVGEEIASDEPTDSRFWHVSMNDRHNFTAYVCCDHFTKIFGGAVFCPAPACGRKESA